VKHRIASRYVNRFIEKYRLILHRCISRSEGRMPTGEGGCAERRGILLTRVVSTKQGEVTRQPVQPEFSVI
jgi:hypothetical protein